MGYKEEFKSYDGTLPNLKGWDDTSWHNDMCPKLSRTLLSKYCSIYLTLWVDWIDSEMREVSPGRFCFTAALNENCEDGYLAIVAETMEGLRAKALDWYTEQAGDSILDQDLTTAQILDCVGEMWAFHKPNC